MIILSMEVSFAAWKKFSSESTSAAYMQIFAASYCTMRIHFLFISRASILSPGSAELAAVGVSISVFNLVSKLFNVPLLNVTTSFVAEQQAVDANRSITGESKQIESFVCLVKSSYLVCISYTDCCLVLT